MRWVRRVKSCADGEGLVWEEGERGRCALGAGLRTRIEVSARVRGIFDIGEAELARCDAVTLLLTIVFQKNTQRKGRGTEAQGF